MASARFSLHRQASGWAAHCPPAVEKSTGARSCRRVGCTAAGAAPDRAEGAMSTAYWKRSAVVDDTETLRIFVEEMLATADPTWRSRWPRMEPTGCGRQRQTVPDLVLLDYSLPDLNGDEICRHLLEDVKTAQVPVIMMSGHVLEMNAAAVEFENIVGTLAKPFISAALVELVERTLRNPRTFAARPKEAPVSAPAGVMTSVPEALPAASKAPASFPEPPATGPPLLTPARFTQLNSNAVVVGLSLEVTSLQFSPTLQISSMHARPVSNVVSCACRARERPCVWVSRSRIRARSGGAESTGKNRDPATCAGRAARGGPLPRHGNPDRRPACDTLESRHDVTSHSRASRAHENSTPGAVRARRGRINRQFRGRSPGAPRARRADARDAPAGSSAQWGSCRGRPGATQSLGANCGVNARAEQVATIGSRSYNPSARKVESTWRR